MAYETPITIKKAIDNIRKRHYVLPSIQREFVWDTDQIETLFDSLMRDYPISTFLFWKVDKSKIKDFQFYEFLKHYHEKTGRHNTKADLDDGDDIIALLDGQQRMTSMYIALTGSYAKKVPYKRRNNPNAFPKRKLYLNLLKPSDELEVEYDFRFLTEEEVVSSDGYFWFECSQILDITDMGKSSMFLMKNGLMDTSKFSPEQSEFAINTLNQFFNVVHQKGCISYFQEEGEELDKVLQIFIRINSGGTKLSYSDLLLSIATAQWKDKDAREVIHEFVDEINQIGDGFAFNKDLVLKACLVLADLKDIKFKVDNFNKANMAKIERNWDETSAAIRTAIELVSKLGYCRDNLLATNTIIPIAYFIYKNRFESKILHAAEHETDRKAVKEWLARVLLKGTFGGQPDSIYPAMRDLINDNLGKFPLTETIAHYRGRRKSISFTEDDVESLLDLQYGKAKTYCALTLLYPGLNYTFKYHQDHIHPKSLFTKRKMRKLGFSEEQIDTYLNQVNGLANLQLLHATTNVEKSNKPFEDWLKAEYPNSADRESFLRQHYIGADESLAFEDFLPFIQQRREKLKATLVKMLDVATHHEPEMAEEL
ncbi:TPA: DUF262 domain-containing protein [Vibrio parahaemolyticus]|uniref:DUF262 domain-containing protein n=1 Tax=Vibrio parahaemolyticus TaxID=670 RepID=UPI001122770F|nr:DUF262 domain-containing protein [Vibrio parahaemolyticus]TOE76937.1 hypothetical protein CGJ36_10015 [Vibrio parahaemolyticus]HCG6610704.1 DUF262 domain-containing protein [Vibrio parahaemolyticus]HCG6613280.1 DUF262 domain-containing protein [Vibrio parahaemolyticus]HCG7077181.1 DUF262 domain-containing protein [Vibrio parahaemolyticus]HCG7079234.1 DUF262 domain-containing protein [Vibrio parahaemolyticus]